MLPLMGSAGTKDGMWFLFAHGAGAGSSSEWMKRYKGYLSEYAPVESFDYPYMREGKRAPNRLPQLITAHREALEVGRKKFGPNVVLVGKSMGSRVGCHVALEEPVRALICFGYPLCGIGKTSSLRDEVLYKLKSPTLFLQGTRDKLCPVPLMQEVLSRRSAFSDLQIIDSGDHSLQPTKTYLKQNSLELPEFEAQTMRFLKQLPK